MSSDESFAWTSASDSNDSCEENVQQVSNKMKIEEKEFDSNGSQKINVFHTSKKAKKRKVSSNEVNHEVPKKKQIKEEPESDIDSKRTKVKLKQELNIGNNDVFSKFDDSYLNLRVKEEQASCVGKSNISKKKKKKRKEKQSDIQTSDIDESTSGEISKIEKNSFSNLSIEDNVNVEVSPRTSVDCAEQISEEQNCHVKHKKKKKKHKISLSNDPTSLDTTNNMHNGEHTEANTLENGYASEGELSNDADISKATLYTSKVSNGIRFEDDISDIDLNETNRNTKLDRENTKPKQVKQYLKRNTNLQPLSSKAKVDSIVTDNDDIWLLRCPRDIDIMNFKGVSLNINTKTKLKLNGKAYDSIVTNDMSKLPIFTYNNQNKPIIMNSKLNGCVILKNKVPKVHILEHAVMINDQTNFIPLPETKCRHPLFGVNYKKSIKIPTQIVERLNTNESLTVVDEDVRKRKKKHKKDKRKSEQEVDLTEKLEEELPYKNKKKRKHSIDNGAPIKAKRVKHDPNSAQTWESEKAIEETLFDF